MPPDPQPFTHQKETKELRGIQDLVSLSFKTFTLMLTHSFIFDITSYAGITKDIH